MIEPDTLNTLERSKKFKAIANFLSKAQISCANYKMCMELIMRRQIQLTWFTAFALAIGLALALPAAHVSAATEKVWRITYGHLSLTKIEAFVKPDALRIQFTTPKFAVIARAPEWKTVWFSETAKAYVEKSLEQFCRDGIAAEFPIDDLRRLKTREKVEGVDGNIKVVSAYYPADFVREMNMFSVMTEEKHAKIRKVWFRASRNIPSSPGVVKFFRGLFRTPDLGEIPLDLDYATVKNEKSNVFYTKDVKQVSVPSTFFTVPSGLKRSSNPYAVLGPEKMREMEDWAQEMGVGDELGKTGTTKPKSSDTSKRRF